VTAETISRWENGHNEADRAVWATLYLLVDDHRSGLTTTLDRLRRLAEARIPQRPVPLTLARARGVTMEAKVLTARVPLSLSRKVDELAGRMKRSRGWIVKQALSAWIEQEEELHRLTLDALADVDSGNVIDHQAVQAWADSLGTRKPRRPPLR